MRRSVRRGCAVFATAFLAGCSSNLAVQKITPGETVTGYPYRLKFTQFEIPIMWRVIACDATKPSSVGGGLKFKITAEPKDKAVPDPSQYYVIDPSRLQGPFRATEFGMEWYDDRSTKTINSTVDDQTGTAIINVLTAAANLASAGVATAGPGAQCTEEVRTALEEIKDQEPTTKAAQKEVQAQTAIVTKLIAKLAALGSSADEPSKQELAQANRVLEAKTAILAAEQAKLNALLETLSDTRTIVWPKTGSEFATPSALKPSDEAMARWGMNDLDTGANVYLALLPTDGPTMRTGNVPAKHRRNVQQGLPYREPRPMKLYVCTPMACGADQTTLESSDQFVAASDVWVLQGGTMFYLPFPARTFANIKSSASFAQNGVLTAAGSNQLRGAGNAIAETLKGGSEQIAATIKGARGAETAKILAEAEEMKAKKALADAKSALEPAAGADKQAAIQAFQTDATLATAERTKIEAEQALAEAKAKLAQ